VAADKNACAGPFGAFCEAWIERERVAAIVGRLLWCIETAPMYASMREALASVPDGAKVIDVPSGGGVAFRALQPGQRIRYLAVDLDPTMLSRARRKAQTLGLHQIEALTADMRHLPFDDGLADACLTYSGLHMIPDPEAALIEMARCLRPGGHIIGMTFLAGGTRRKRLLFSMGARTGHHSPNGTGADLKRWLNDAGFTELEVSDHNSFALFTGRKR
jgi:SAM-dependent methyltransferase